MDKTHGQRAPPASPPSCFCRGCAALQPSGAVEPWPPARACWAPRWWSTLFFAPHGGGAAVRGRRRTRRMRRRMGRGIPAGRRDTARGGEETRHAKPSALTSHCGDFASIRMSSMSSASPMTRNVVRLHLRPSRSCRRRRAAVAVLPPPLPPSSSASSSSPSPSSSSFVVFRIVAAAVAAVAVIPLQEGGRTTTTTI